MVILLGLLLVNQLVSHPLDYIKEGGVPRSVEAQERLNRAKHTSAGRNIPEHDTGCRVLRYSGGPNLSKFVSCVLSFTLKFQSGDLSPNNLLPRASLGRPAVKTLTPGTRGEGI